MAATATTRTIRIVVDASAARSGGQEVERAMLGISDAVQRTQSMFGLLRNALAAFGAMEIGRIVAGWADEYTNLQSRLRLVTESTTALTRVQDALFQSSLRTRSAFGETVSLYATLTRASKTLHLTEQQRLTITENINKAMALGGGSAQAQEAALVQLGQAMASGVLRGQEFNSIAEQAPILLDTLAKKLGVTTGELRKMAGEGKLTAEVVANSLLGATADLDKQFSRVSLTIGGAATNLRSAAVVIVGELDKAVGASAGFASLVNGIAQTLASPTFMSAAKAIAGGLVDIGVAAGLVFGGRLLSGWAKAGAEMVTFYGQMARGNVVAIGGAQAQAARAKATLDAAIADQRAAAANLAGAQATQRMVVAQSGQVANLRAVAAANNQVAAAAVAKARADAVATAAAAAHEAAAARLTLAGRASAVAMRGLQAVLAFFGGPIGLAITALAAGVYLLATRQSDAEKIATAHAAALEATAAAGGETKRTFAEITSELQKMTAAQREAAALKIGEAIAKQWDEAKIAYDGALKYVDSLRGSIMGERVGEVSLFRNLVRDAGGASAEIQGKAAEIDKALTGLSDDWNNGRFDGTKFDAVVGQMIKLRDETSGPLHDGLVQAVEALSKLSGTTFEAGKALEYLQAWQAAVKGTASEQQKALIDAAAATTQLGSANTSAAAAMADLNQKIAAQAGTLAAIRRLPAGVKDIADQVAKIKDAFDALADAEKAGLKGADLDQYLEQRKKSLDLTQAIAAAQKDLNDAAAIRSESTGGVDKLNERLADAARFLQAGTISAAEFNAEAAKLRSDVQDKYNSAVKDGNDVLAASIKAEYDRGKAGLQASLDTAKGALDAARAMDAMGVSAANALRSAASASESFGGIFATLGGWLRQAADGLDKLTAQSSGVKQAEASVAALQDRLNNWKPLSYTGKASTGGGAAKNLADGYADQVKDVTGAIEAQKRLNEAYAQGPDAVRKLKEEQELQSQVAKLNRKYTDDQTAALSALYRKQADAKRTGDILAGTQAINDNIALTEKELSLVGATRGEREKILAVYKAQVELGDMANTVEGKARIAAIARQADLTEAIQQQREVLDQSRSVAKDIGDFLVDGLVNAAEGGKSTFKDFWDSMLASAKRFLANLVSLFAQNQIILPIVTKIVGGAPGLFGVGGNASSMFGLEPGSSGSSSSAGMGGMGGGLSLPGGWIDSAGQWLFGGNVVGPNGPTLPSAGLLGTRGNVFGMTGGQFLSGGLTVLGSALPGLMSGNFAQAGVGLGTSLAGFGIGSALGGSVLGMAAGPFGAMVGGLLGNVLGGLFGGAKKVPFSAGAINFTDGKFELGSAYGKGGQGADGVRTLGEAAAKGMNDLLTKLGLTIQGDIGKLVYQSRLNNRSNSTPGDFTGFSIEKDKIQAKVAGDTVYSGKDQQQAASAFIGAMLKQLAQGGKLAGDELLTQVLRGLKDYSTEAIDKALSFAQAYKAFVEVKDPLTDVEQQVKTLRDTAKDLAKQAAEYGIGADKINAALVRQIETLRKAVNDDLDRGIRGFTDGVRLGWDDLMKAQGQGMKDVIATSGDIGKRNRLNYLQQLDYLLKLSDAQRRMFRETATAAERAVVDVADAMIGVTTILDKQISDISSALSAWRDVPKLMQDAIDSLTISTASPLSVPERLAEAQRQFEDLRRKALGGDADAARNLPQLGQNLLQLADQMYGSTSSYAGIFDGVTKALAEVRDFGKGQVDTATGTLQRLDKQVDLLGQIKGLLAAGLDANSAQIRGLIDALAKAGYDTGGLQGALDKLGQSQAQQQRAQVEATRSQLGGQIGTVQAQLAQIQDRSQGDKDRLAGLVGQAQGIGGLGGQTVGFGLAARNPALSAAFAGDFNKVLATLGLPGSIDASQVIASPIKRQFEVDIAGRRFAGSRAADLFVPMMQAMLDAGSFGAVWDPLAQSIRGAGSLTDLVSQLQSRLSDWTNAGAQKSELERQLASLRSQFDALPKFATGGIFGGGRGGIDDGLAWLTNGEAVLNRGAADRLGPAGVARLNAGGQVNDNAELIEEVRALRAAVQESDRRNVAAQAEAVRLLTARLEALEEENRQLRRETQHQSQQRRTA